MQALVVFAMVLAAANSQYIYSPYTYSAYNVPASTVPLHSSVVSTMPVARTIVQQPTTYVQPMAATKTQYHQQDVAGQYSYGYSHPGQSKAEMRDAAGNVRGSYAYIDPRGKQVQVNYVSDSLGYRVESNDLPVAPRHKRDVQYVSGLSTVGVPTHSYAYSVPTYSVGATHVPTSYGYSVGATHIPTAYTSNVVSYPQAMTYSAVQPQVVSHVTPVETPASTRLIGGTPVIQTADRQFKTL